MRKDGFYTALGTPLDDQGKVVKQSFVKQIEDQIASGASGLLVMGTMGALGTIRNSAYEEIIECACEAIAGRATLLVGCSDNSLARVKDRFAILERYPVDIAVLTAPYYFKMPDQVLERFFARAAALTGMDIYLYDHVPITKHKITFPIMMNLSKIKNNKGLKS
ncbi:MAG: dihydrodipicolinate synthase family protein, partial [Sphaerochaetaceae bacterium]|nr:dihydrodipicolinate synthase family protein [Sphaerochaetaceae bacterium]